MRAPLIRQLDLPLEPASSLPRQGPALLQRDGTTLLVHLIRVRAARRYVLRVRPDGALRVTIPSGGSRAEALQFAERHLAWAFRERTRLLDRASDASGLDHGHDGVARRRAPPYRPLG